MSTTKPKPEVIKRKRGVPEKIKEREAYLLWRSIPAMLSLLPASEQRKMGYDVEDPLFKQLIAIKTKTEFCALMKVSSAMPSTWEKDPDFVETVRQLSLHQHVLRFQKDVDFAFTQKLLKEGDAPRMKLWKQLFEGWTEKSQVQNTNIDVSTKELQAFIEARNKELWDKNDELNDIEDEEEDLDDIEEEKDIPN